MYLTVLLLAIASCGCNGSPVGSSDADAPTPVVFRPGLSQGQGQELPWPAWPVGTKAQPWPIGSRWAMDTAPGQDQRGVLQDVYATVFEAYQEIAHRQQSLLDLIYCRNCSPAFSPWQNFLHALATIPAMSWVGTPHPQAASGGSLITASGGGGTAQGGATSGSFIAATHLGGVVHGVAGSIVNNRPVVEYTFNNHHVTHVPVTKP